MNLVKKKENIRLNFDQKSSDKSKNSKKNSKKDSIRKQSIRKKSLHKKDINVVNSDTILEYAPKHEVRHQVFKKFELLILKLWDLNKDLVDYKYSEFDLIKMAINLEKGIFNGSILLKQNYDIGGFWDIRFKAVYTQRFISIYYNLDPDSYINNKNLHIRFFQKEFTIHYLCTTMNCYEMFPEIYQKYFSQKNYEKELVEKYNNPVLDNSGQMKCRKCKKYNTVLLDLRMRKSADEPMTATILCIDKKCKFRYTCDG